MAVSLRCRPAGDCAPRDDGPWFAHCSPGFQLCASGKRLNIAKQRRYLPHCLHQQAERWRHGASFSLPATSTTPKSRHRVRTQGERPQSRRRVWRIRQPRIRCLPHGRASCRAADRCAVDSAQRCSRQPDTMTRKIIGLWPSVRPTSSWRRSGLCQCGEHQGPAYRASLRAAQSAARWAGRCMHASSIAAGPSLTRGPRAGKRTAAAYV